MLVKIKGYLKPIECQLEAHMGYDSKNEEVINPNGKHQWCLWMQSMSMLKKEENITKLRVTLPLKQMTAHGRYMKVGVVLNPPNIE
jgi:hypothetical protein